MIYTELTKKALKLCFEAHRDQTDKSGLPYVFHPFHLAEQMSDEATTVAALLHDVVEDTALTLEDLRAMGFPPEVTDALALLTHDENVPYFDYVARIRDNSVARAVKLADLRHNSDLSRLDEVTEEDRARAAKYERAMEILMEGSVVCYEWLNEAVGDFDLLAAVDREEYERTLERLGSRARTSCLEDRYFFFLNTRRKILTPMPFLALAFGGMYNGDGPVGRQVDASALRLEDYGFGASVWGAAE